MEHIRVFSDKGNENSINISQIRKTRKKEQDKRHIEYLKVGGMNV